MVWLVDWLIGYSYQIYSEYLSMLGVFLVTFREYLDFGYSTHSNFNTSFNNHNIMISSNIKTKLFKAFIILAVKSAVLSHKPATYTRKFTTRK